MNATVNVLCYKSKILSNGEHPLMIRVCKDSKKKYQSIGISVKPEYWDFEKNKPKRNCPNKEQIERIIAEKIKIFSNQIIEYKAENKEFTVINLIEKVNTTISKKTVGQLLNDEISRLREASRLKYASTYKELKTSLLDFNKHLDIYFSFIDVNWLKQYEAWLRNCAQIT